jgi:hypothetical protein
MNNGVLGMAFQKFINSHGAGQCILIVMASYYGHLLKSANQWD